MLLITLDNLASRYHMLPSEALERATTFDLKVLDVSAKWEARKQKVAMGQESEKITPKLTQEQMKAMIKRVKERT